jgi:ribosomal protein L37AE/L43A
MAQSSSRQHATAVLLDDEQDIVQSATCPMCHTSATLAQSALEASGDWRCVRCGQRWDAARLAAVAAYAAWAVDHDRDRVARRGSEDSRGAALDRDPPTERLGGAP